ncbi:hypothetical protein AAH055_12550, partial [Bacteroides uniformis]
GELQENRTGILDYRIAGTYLFSRPYVEHDSKSLAMAIESFYHDKTLCNMYGRNGRKFVVDNFEQYIIWREIEKLYLQA